MGLLQGRGADNISIGFFGSNRCPLGLLLLIPKIKLSFPIRATIAPKKEEHSKILTNKALEFIYEETNFLAGDREGWACGQGGRQRRGSLCAPSVDFYVIFSFDRSALFKGLDVIEL